MQSCSENASEQDSRTYWQGLGDPLAELVARVEVICGEARWAELHHAGRFPTEEAVRVFFRKLLRERGVDVALEAARRTYERLVWPADTIALEEPAP